MENYEYIKSFQFGTFDSPFFFLQTSSHRIFTVSLSIQVIDSNTTIDAKEILSFEDLGDPKFIPSVEISPNSKQALVANLTENK
jgi:hypothetical protein